MSLLTLAVLSFNQEQSIEAAALAALAQDYSPLQVIFSDDCSADSTFDRLRTVVDGYSGPHEVLIRRNETNLGLLGHINAVIEYARGEVVVMAAGDDRSAPCRCSLIAAAFARDPRIHGVFTDYTNLTDGQDLPEYKSVKGSTRSASELAFGGGGVGKGATYAYRRSVFCAPSVLPNHLRSEDRILPLRAAIQGKVVFLDAKTVVYDDRDDSRMSVALKRGGHLAKNSREHIGYLHSELDRMASMGEVGFVRRTVLKALLTLRYLVDASENAQGGSAWAVRRTELSTWLVRRTRSVLARRRERFELRASR